MDDATLTAYDRHAAAYAEDWETQPPPSDLHDIVRKYFVRGATADIGCGSGRDTAWLNDNGFPAVGYEASDGLLAEARMRHPQLRFRHGTLPELKGIADNSFANVLCETVIMHLDQSAITSAVSRLLAILVPGGTLYLTWRVTEGTDRRDAQGRLYAVLDPERILSALAQSEIFLDEQRESVSSGKVIRRIIARKAGVPASS